MKNSEYRFTTVIGIDISKNKIDIADSQNSAVQTVANSKPQIDAWITSIANQSNAIVLMEATGGYESLLVERLHQNNIPLAVVNPRQVRDFARGIGHEEKRTPLMPRSS